MVQPTSNLANFCTANPGFYDLESLQDIHIIAGQDEIININRNRTIETGGTHTETIKGNTTIQITTGNYNHDVLTGNEMRTVKGNFHNEVKGGGFFKTHGSEIKGILGYSIKNIVGFYHNSVQGAYNQMIGGIKNEIVVGGEFKTNFVAKTDMGKAAQFKLLKGTEYKKRPTISEICKNAKEIYNGSRSMRVIEEKLEAEEKAEKIKNTYTLDIKGESTATAKNMTQTAKENWTVHGKTVSMTADGDMTVKCSKYQLNGSTFDINSGNFKVLN